MKNKILLGGVICVALFIAGCSSNPFVTSEPNPAYVTANPQTGVLTTNPAVSPVIYLPSPQFTALSKNIVNGYLPAAQTIAAFVPVPGVAAASSIAQPIVYGVLGLISTILAGIATAKNSQANSATQSAQQHQAAAAALAAAVTQAGVSSNAMNIAGTNGSAGTVAVHLANAQSPV